MPIFLTTMGTRHRLAAPALALAAALAGCASPPDTPAEAGASPWARKSLPAHAAPGGIGPGAWRHQALPGKATTGYRYVQVDGRDALAADALASASMMRRTLRVEPAQLGQLRFSWKVPALIAEADLGRRGADDTPVRIVLAFEGDRSRFSSRDAMLSELARALTGEEMPYATLMYVWCNQRPAGTVVNSPRTDRIRKWVVESGPARLGQWQEYVRDVRADYERAFGEAPGALVGIAVMTDTDNTGARAAAWYGPLQLGPDAIPHR